MEGRWIRAVVAEILYKLIRQRMIMGGILRRGRVTAGGMHRDAQRWGEGGCVTFQQTRPSPTEGQFAFSRLRATSVYAYAVGTARALHAPPSSLPVALDHASNRVTGRAIP